mgnify:CR=1 FL=1
MGKKTVRGHDIANRFVYSLRGFALGEISFYIPSYWNSGSIRPYVLFFLLYTTFTSSVSALVNT